MTVLPILVWPHPVLAAEAKNVDLSTPESLVEVKSLITDMLDSMNATGHGIGIAAPQIGVSKRVIITEVDGKSVAMVNPVLLGKHGSVLGEEGCLSVPGFTGMVTRAAGVSVYYQDDVTGAVQKMDLDGKNAIVIQHEVDHLDGIVFVQHLTKTKRDFIKKKLAKLK